jgi:hypothetical protein
MKSVKTLVARLGLLVIVVSLASSAFAAQWARPGGLQIVRAEYGAGKRMIDVTAQLNSRIQDGQLYLQVTNANMGGDPARGDDKVLNVTYVYNGQRGQTTVREGGYLKLGGSGGYGYQSGLRILRADWGAGSRSMDVTYRLNSLIQGGQLNVQATNANMGGDPARGADKTLNVEYVYNGQQGRMTVREGEFLKLGGSNYAGYQSGLQILRAQWGAGQRMMDVTYRLNSQIQNGQLSLQVTNANMGGDPARGEDKVLNVEYVYNGQQGQTSVREGGFLRLGGSGVPMYESGLQILRAEWGVGQRMMDVTHRLNSQIVGGQLDLRVTNAAMGGDPAQGEDKFLYVQYAYNGQQAQLSLREGDYLRLPGGAGASGWGSYGVIPSGTQLSIRTNEVIDSKTSTVGQRFSGVMYADVLNSSGTVAIPKGADVGLIIRQTSASDLVLDVDSVVVNGQRYYVSTSDLEKKGAEGVGANRRTAEMVGGGAAAGAIIGAILGGGKGAAIGAAVGGAGGAGVQVLTRGKEVRVPAETVLNFKLDQDLRLQLRNW